MFTLKQLNAEKIEIQMKGRIEELEKTNQSLRAELLERSLSEEALRISEEKYRTLFNSTDESFFVIEVVFNSKGKAADYRILEADQSQEKVTGLLDVGDRQVSKPVPEINKNWIKSFSQVALTGGSVQFESRIEDVDRWFDVRILRIGDEYSRKVAVIVKDITERKKAEETLLNERARLQAIIDTIPAGFLISDAITQISALEEIQVQAEDLEAQTEELRIANEALYESEKRFELLNEANALLLSSNEPEKVIQTIAEKVMHYLNCNVFFNYIYDEARDRLHLNACSGINAEAAKEIEWLNVGDEKAIWSCVACNNCLIFAQDWQNNKDKRENLIQTTFIQAYACQPLHAGETTIGTLYFGKKNRVSFTKDELCLMSSVANQISIAIERKFAERKISRYNRILEGINNIFSSVVQAKTEKELGNECLSVVLEVTGSQFGFINEIGVDGLLHDVAKSELAWEQCFMYGKTEHSCLPGDFAVHGLYGSVINNKKSFYTNDPQSHPDSIGLPHGHPPLTSFLGVPLLLDGKIMGLIGVANREGGYSSEQQKDLEKLASAVIQALHRKKEEKERAWMEEALRRSEENLRQRLLEIENLYRNAPVGLCELDRELRYVRINELRAEFNGFSVADHIGKQVKDIVPQFADIMESRMLHVLETGEPLLDIEVAGEKMSHPGIKRSWLEQWLPITDDQGIVTGLNIVAEETTERKKAEKELTRAYEDIQAKSGELHKINDELKAQSEELKEANKALVESEKRFRTLAENSPDMIVRLDRKKRVRYANPAFVEIYGRSKEEIIGKTPGELWRYYGQLNFWEEHYEKVLATGKTETVESQYVSPRGKKYYFNTKIVPEFIDGKVVSILEISRDITDQKKVEKELKLARDYNRSLIEVSLDPLVTIGYDGKITDTNTATELITGYTRDELIGTDFSDYFTEPERARKGYQHVFQKGLVRDYPLEILHKDGHITHVLYNASVYRNENGEVIGVFAAAHDITEIKKAEKERQLASKYNRSLIEASIDPLVTIGPDGKITDVNRATESITGYSRRELIGTDFSDYFTEPERARKGYQHVFQKGLVRDYPLEIWHKDGHITHVLYNASVYRNENGEVIGVFAAARDITEIKKAEEKIQTLANIVESSNDAIITESLDGIITSWNKGAEQIYGYMAEEVLGKNRSILEPENFKGEIKQLSDQIKQGKKVRHHETLRLKKDGTTVNISVTLSPVFDDSGKLVAISDIAGDITEKKIAENLLYEKQIAEAANRTKSEFLANISHELRTPLNSIIGFSDMLYEQVYGELNKRQLRAVENVSNSGKHLLNLINGILDLSKIEAKKMELDYKEFDLAARLNLIRNILLPIADKKNIRIEIVIDSGLTRICADEEKFVRIMYNLVDNAIKFSYENSFVRIRARKKGDMVEIMVKDRGIGIKPEDQHKLFRPFSQVDTFSSKKYQGTGLGLSLVKQIVHLHGGYVWFRSHPGEGSTFAFIIPIGVNVKVPVCCQ
ncbi:PAS domain S-box protein [Methanosarcina hadiensis]|uniref:PAS domain S-box protein n=1 Tax=Methanosarcina hadiensis TaxID=3078083 RepID=UPI0039777AD2